MKKHLIIALGDKEVILRASMIVQLLTRKYPRDQFDVLCFKQHQKIAMQINGINQVHNIDCQAINHALDNSYYCDMYAFNGFVNDLAPIFDESWEQAINCSDLKIAAHLASVIHLRQQTPIVGSRMGVKDNRLTSDLWSMFDYVQDELYPLTLISKSDLYPILLRSSFKEETVFFNYDEAQNTKAYQLLQKVRSANNGQCKLIGIPLFNALHNKNFNFERVVETVGELLDDIDLFPLIITSRNERDQVYARQLSKEFANSLIIIEVDDQTLAPVLYNLDALIGNDPFISNFADLLGVNALRLTDKLEGTSKSYQYNTHQLTLVAPAQLSASQLAKDLHVSIKHLLGDEPALDRLSNSTSLYVTKLDRLGHYPFQIAGVEQTQFNLHHQMMRTFVSTMAPYSLDPVQSVESSGVELPAIKQWAQQQRTCITDASRDLLGTLRSLLRTQKDKKFIGEFIHSLDKLFKQGESNSLASLCCNLFRARIDSIETSNFHENIQQMEKSLYLLKDDLQRAIALIKNVEDYAHDQTNHRRFQSLTNPAPTV